MAVGWIGFAVLPWYGLESNFFSLGWLFRGYPLDSELAPALFLVAQGMKPWLAPMALLLALPLLLWRRPKNDPRFGAILIAVGAFGLFWFFLQGYGIGLRGWRFEWMNALFGELGDRQFGMGYGAMLVGGAFLFLLSLGIAARGAVGGDVFVVSSIAFVVAMVTLFIFVPILQMLANAMITDEGSYSLGSFGSKLFSSRLWGLDCLWSSGRCGVAWNSLFLAVVVGVVTTLLGLVFALVATRTQYGLPQRPSRAHRAADHHPALRHRPGHHPALRPLRRRQPGRCRVFRLPAQPLGLWPAGPVDRPDPGLHPDRLSGADRRRRGRKPVDGGGGADAARQQMAGPSSTSPCR